LGNRKLTFGQTAVELLTSSIRKSSEVSKAHNFQQPFQPLKLSTLNQAIAREVEKQRGSSVESRNRFMDITTEHLKRPLDLSE
jgi:hypothetical protein